MGVKALQKIQLGAESTAGTAVAATAIWRGEGANIQDARVVTRVPETVGIPVPTNRTYIGQLGATLAMNATPATFEQLPYILEAGIKSETPAQDGTGSGYIYEYELGTSSVNTIRTYTIETGDNQQAEEMEYSFVTDFSISGNAGESLMVSANWLGRQASNVSFTAALTPDTVEEILSTNGTIYLDAVSGSYGGSAISAGNILSFTMDVNTGRAPKYTIDSSQLYFDHQYLNFNALSVSGSIVWEHAATAVTEKTNWRNETYRLMRLLFDGSALSTPGVYSEKTILIDVPIYWESFDALSDQDGNSIVQANFVGGYDTTDTTALKITVVNELSALP